MRDKEYPYRDWTDDKRSKFINRLISIAQTHTRIGIGGLLVLDDYNNIVPRWLREERGHPYYFCFQLFFDNLIPLLETTNLRLPEGQQAAFVFDRNQQFRREADRAFDEIKEIRDENNRMGSLTWGDRKRHLPLQAADLIAYLVRNDMSLVLKGEPRRDWVDELIKKRNIHVGYFDKNNLQKYVDGITDGRLMGLNVARRPHS
jgi:hypothetical protein